jgi:hypothetical protein
MMASANVMELRAHGQVSAWLSSSGLNYITTTRDGTRIWLVGFKSEGLSEEFPMVLYAAGTTFGVAMQMQSQTGPDWRDDVWNTLEWKVPFVRVLRHKDEAGTLQPHLFWIQVDVPMDLTFEPSILHGAMLQALTAVHTAARVLLENHPQRFVPQKPTWINVPQTLFAPR